MAELLVKSVFTITSRNLIGIIGIPLSGEIKVGMFLFSADGIQRCQIATIEGVRSDNHADVGFLVKYESPEKLIYLKEMENKIVRVDILS